MTCQLLLPEPSLLAFCGECLQCREQTWKLQGSPIDANSVCGQDLVTHLHAQEINPHLSILGLSREEGQSFIPPWSLPGLVLALDTRVWQE